LKLKFDGNQDYQIEAIKSIVDIFEGQTSGKLDFEISTRANTIYKNELGIGNNLELEDKEILKNVQKIQLHNGIAKSLKLEGMNFTVEMETGTGKTYVYLRTILELNKNYGFTKFIIVVPSIAIKEGVYKNLQITEEHLKTIYDNISYNYFIYDSKKINSLSSYAKSNQIEIMIINIDSFNKDLNVINNEIDRMQGRKPLEFIQSTNPIVIIDEPQNMESDKSKKAIKSLNPMCTLRYSATHKNLYNLMYRLTPVDSYKKKLVKKIEVMSVTAEENLNTPFIELVKVDNKNGIKASIKIDKKEKSGVNRKNISVKNKTDLFDISGEREVYKGWIIENISIEMGKGIIEFSNGKFLYEGQNFEQNKDEVQRTQIRNTIIEHLNKELRLKAQGIKVLSLFFIDKVANYRSYDDNGNTLKGKFSEWFEEEYNEIIKRDRYKELNNFSVEEIHNGYFSIDKSGKKKGQFKDTKGTTNDDDDTYQLIMKDKEKLLDLKTPLKFIFSHSTLIEGWDNPNVFQICTLNETKSVIKKRQEIGRGLRLAVNQNGIRERNHLINTLTVMANESYEEFVEKLQKELEEDTGMKFGIIEKHIFSKIIEEKEGQFEAIGYEKSEYIYNDLEINGYIDKKGKVKDKFFEDIENDDFKISEHLKEYKDEVIEIIKENTTIKDRISNARDKAKIKLNKRIYLNSDFKVLWDKIKYKTTYSVEYKTIDLIKKSLKEIEKMDLIEKVVLRSKKAEVKIEEKGLSTKETKDQLSHSKKVYELPDILTYLQNETNLTRDTIVEVLIKSNRLNEFENNPQRFMDEIAKILNRVLKSMIIEGIKYEKIDNEVYEMRNFEETEVERDLIKLFKTEKSVYDYIEFDSEIERKFAEKLNDRDDIKLFVKLPAWFKVDTPVGTYNPDWAIVKDDEQKGEKLYLVRETKGSIENGQLRPNEEFKIDCGKQHFKALDINYKVVTKLEEL